MGTRRSIFAVLAALCLAGCAAGGGVANVTDVRLAGAALSGGGEIPSCVTLLVTVDNPSQGVKISGGRLRISYRGRRVAMLTLAEAVKIPPRRTSEVAIPLRVNVVHNSAALSLRAAVRRRDADGIGIELEASARSGLFRGEAAGQGAVPLAKAVPPRMLEEVWRALDEFTEPLSVSGGGE